jgi:biofilm PGA synthesis N-glycosyltransferase PgaC
VTVIESPRPASTPTPDPGRGPRRFYVSVTGKFVLSVAFAIVWVGVSAWISMSWIDELTASVNSFTAWLIVGLVAYIPGFIVAHVSSVEPLSARITVTGPA